MKTILKHAAVFSILLAGGLGGGQAQARPSAPATAPGDASPGSPDSIVARGKGFVIKRSHLDEAVNSYQANAISRGQDVPPEKMAVIQAELLDRLIESAILNLHASSSEKAQGVEEGNKRFEMVKQHAPSLDALVKQLESIHLTLDLLRSRLIEEATFEAALRSKITVSEAQVKEYYDTHPAAFEQPEMVRASHILLSTIDLKTGKQLSDEEKAAKKKQIEALLKRARGGEDFAKLAKEYSEDPGAKASGGEYTFPRGRMVAEFEAAAFSLKPNQISEVVTTQFGYHIIKLSEKIPAHKIPYADAKARLKGLLEEQQMELLMPHSEGVPKFVADLKKENSVEILDPKIKEAEAKLEVMDSSK